ncbi:MAG: valine--tRNA ligase [Candidatus Peregrinibacteria bacterium]
MLPKAYDPTSCEDRIYKLWEDSGAFKADPKSSKEAFTVSMPPPNATGQLHLGHAVMLALQDIFIRFSRARGKEALWIPGTDHAAIATESVVIRKIQKEEKIKDPRGHYGRTELVRRIAEFVAQSQATIRGQVRKMGASCDWSRERYTMDASLNRCVNEVFQKMYADGLIYRGNRVVNWDTALQTTISDDEIEYEDREGLLYTFEYLSAEQTGGEALCVATSRPETKLGDTAIIVHPDDERYEHLIGRHFEVAWPGGVTGHVTVIADHTVDREFGTGAIGCTPFHSKIDYEIWQRHKEEIIAEPKQIIGEDGLMTENAGSFAGLSVEICRQKFIEELRENGRLKKEEKYTQPLSISYRSKKPVEPLPKLQWFIDVNKKAVVWPIHRAGLRPADLSPRPADPKMSLKEIMQQVVRTHAIRIIPDRFERTYFQWIDHLQDWCISRQIWWGHRVPVYYCVKCAAGMSGQSSYERLAMSDELKAQSSKLKAEGVPGAFVSSQSLNVCPECGGKVEQDPDTLDTWFSSGLWTWSTLIDPAMAQDMSLSLEDLLKLSPDFQKFHPTAVMETAYDILFFWVARMILMTTYATGQIPFKTVYLHGLVRTREGKKMSKSDPSTCIDPLEIIPQYGADALRLAMIVGQMPGNDFQLYMEKIGGYRNFINKLWNASRFVLLQCENAKADPKKLQATSYKLQAPAELSLADKALLSELQKLITDVTEGLETYRLSETGERLYSFVWDFFCDWYLELSKGEAHLPVLVHALRTIVQLLHPYCPFVTEELWEAIKPEGAGLLMLEPWPVIDERLRDPIAEEHFALLTNVITSIRQLRAEYGIAPEAKIVVSIFSDDHQPLLESQKEHIIRLARLSSLAFEKPKSSKGIVSAFLKGAEVHVSLEGAIDLPKLKANLLEEKLSLKQFLDRVDAKLGNAKFMEHAQHSVIELEQQKRKDAEERMAKVEERLKSLS